jgi:hypothetical protein
MDEEYSLNWWLYWIHENIFPIGDLENVIIFVCCCCICGFLFYSARKEKIEEKQKNKSLK